MLRVKVKFPGDASPSWIRARSVDVADDGMMGIEHPTRGVEWIGASRVKRIEPATETQKGSTGWL